MQYAGILTTKLGTQALAVRRREREAGFEMERERKGRRPSGGMERKKKESEIVYMQTGRQTSQTACLMFDFHSSEAGWTAFFFKWNISFIIERV